jgi:RNA polymerase sigma factor FliA
MKHDHRSFSTGTAVAPASAPPAFGKAIAGAYCGDIGERVRRFLPMVRRIAWHVHGTGRPGIEIEDLVQSGLVALTECAQRHQGPGEDGFAAYAKMRVRGAMVDLIRRTAPLSRGAAGRRKALREHEDQLRGRLGREATSAELAAAMGIEESELAMLRSTSEPLRFESIEESYSDSDMAFADARPDSLALLADEEMRGSVIAAIQALPQRLQLVIQLYFVEELNLSEIAEVLSVYIPRVHQLKAQALGQLRKALESVAEVL